MVIFYGEELLAPRPTPKLEDHPLSGVRDCLCNVFAATLRIRRTFLHPKLEDAPCRGDRDLLIMDSAQHISYKETGKLLTDVLPFLKIMQFQKNYMIIEILISTNN
jgi:hypothetical protein